jgi:hypothetical protein
MKEFPTSAVGKVLRRELRQVAAIEVASVHA